ncbi:hypothetical protein DRO32_01160 [Candidatus Bathyarchaeota archaeon]|nr:MAG: hypothetical protein DRO32_01160 [Candidatus Bathyarchaeota archaeon]
MSRPSLAQDIAVRVFRAAVSGVVAYLISYVIPKFLLEQALITIEEYIPLGGMVSPLRLLEYFAFITVFYTVTVELTRKTVLEHFFSVGRGLTMLFFFIYASGGGIINFSVPLSQVGLAGAGNLSFRLDVSRVLFILIGIDFLDIGKSIINAVNFLSEKVEEELEELAPRRPTPILALPGRLGLVVLAILVAVLVLMGVLAFFFLKGFGGGLPLPLGG